MGGEPELAGGRQEVLQTLRAVIMQAPLPMAFYERQDLRVAIANDAYIAIMGGRDMRGKPLLDAVPELRDRPTLNTLLDAINGTPGALQEYVADLEDEHGNRRPRYFSAAYHPVRDEHGEVYGVVVVGIEITETVRARHAAEQYGKRMTVLAEASHAYVEAGLDLDKVHATVVDQLVAHTYDGAMLHRLEPGADELELVAVAHRDPQRRGALERAFRQHPPRLGRGFAGRVAATGTSMLIPGLEPNIVRAMSKPAFEELGEKFPIFGLLVVPVHAHGTMLGTLTVSRSTQEPQLDLDDQILIEELADRAALAIVAAEQFAELRAAKAAVEAERAKFESLVMQMPVPTAVYEGPELRLTLLNDAGARMVPVSGAPGMMAVAETMRTGEPRTLSEHIAPVRDSSGVVEPRVFVSSYVPVRDGANRVTGVLTAAHDVTEQVRAREDLEASLRFSEQLIGMLGHDLRNPLNAINVAATYLRFTAHDADMHGKEMIDRILDSSSRMSTMVSQLLDLTRTRLVGGITLARRETRLSAIVERALAELRLLYPGRAIERDTGADARGAWDADRLVQVFSNLVDNALAYGDPTRAVAVRLNGCADHARVEVHNHGREIPAEVLPVLFEPYRRTGARNRESRGLGLGLFISQQIVQAHGGHITVESAAISGTTFVVTLPMQRASDSH